MMWIEWLMEQDWMIPNGGKTSLNTQIRRGRLIQENNNKRAFKHFE